ncbi:MAG: lipid-A-disaccharide synthase [Planctomycetota bacterium]
MTRPLRIFISAGEESGDRHGAELVRALADLEPTAEIRGVGGKRMAEAGCDLHHDPTDLAVMWFLDVFRNLRTFVRLFESTVRELGAWKPDVLVPIDYPGFNLRLADRAKGMDVPVVYYISPQVWAWFPGRVHRIAEVVDRMVVIFPFEEPFYRDVGVTASYVGHPVVDHLASLAAPAPVPAQGAPLVALLPGSRRAEVRRNLPLMLAAASRLAENQPLRFASAFHKRGLGELASTLARDFPHPYSVATDESDASATGAVQALMAASRLTLVGAGSATVELAALGVPMVVLYKVSLPAYLLYLLLNRAPHIAMVNLLAGRRAVPEFLLWRDLPDRVARAALPLLEAGPARDDHRAGLNEVRRRLGSPGASRRAAAIVLQEARRERERRERFSGVE